MRNSVKTLVFLTTFLLFQRFSFAQFKLPVGNAVANDVKKVIEDYPNRFINLMGEVITENPQSTDYRCNFKVNGAEESFITRYSAKKEVCSWEALMLTTENFDKAKQKFKALFNQLNNLSVNINDTKTTHLKGKYEAPEEEKKFTSVLFSFEPASAIMAKLKVEVVMQYHAPMEWKLKVMVYDREREDNERGPREESGVGSH
ncbi:MAG TPA: hypothetical protein VMZ03_00040 [Chitinophagaceae bacterium]|nr:hypothetical protein [Chitinophagaceae bacterium]